MTASGPSQVQGVFPAAASSSAARLAKRAPVTWLTDSHGSWLHASIATRRLPSSSMPSVSRVSLAMGR